MLDKNIFFFIWYQGTLLIFTEMLHENEIGQLMIMIWFRHLPFLKGYQIVVLSVLAKNVWAEKNWAANWKGQKLKLTKKYYNEILIIGVIFSSPQQRKR
jgi:hypothetical protein